jgi:hypothetical protein
MERPGLIQFGMSQLLWAVALVATWLIFVRISLTHDLRQPPEPEWIFTILATPPLGGGLIGLLINKTKGMLVGIAIGGLVVALFLLIAPIL